MPGTRPAVCFLPLPVGRATAGTRLGCSAPRPFLSLTVSWAECSKYARPSQRGPRGCYTVNKYFIFNDGRLGNVGWDKMGSLI